MRFDDERGGGGERPRRAGRRWASTSSGRRPTTCYGEILLGRRRFEFDGTGTLRPTLIARVSRAQQRAPAARHRAVDEVGVDRVVDARAAAAAVGGVLGAVEREQLRAGDAGHHRLRARVRAWPGRRWCRSTRIGGAPLHLHVAELVALGRLGHARRTTASPRRRPTAGAAAWKRGDVGELARRRSAPSASRTVDAADDRVGLHQRVPRAVGAPAEVLVGEREQRRARALLHRLGAARRPGSASRGTGRRASDSTAVSSRLGVSTPSRVTPLAVYDAGNGCWSTRAMSCCSTSRGAPADASEQPVCSHQSRNASSAFMNPRACWYP